MSVGETKHAKLCAEMARQGSWVVLSLLAISLPEETIRLCSMQRSGTYRSLVCCIVYIARERSDVQHTVKCRASYLSFSTEHAWQQLGRLIGYLQRTLGYGVQVQRSQPGTSLCEKLAESGNQIPIACIATIYIKHILDFLLETEVEALYESWQLGHETDQDWTLEASWCTR